ncbi:MAG: peptidoglycan D,D-transpeptidase FtsI family protein [Candidatus Omnitrophota bacterium]
MSVSLSPKRIWITFSIAAILLLLVLYQIFQLCVIREPVLRKTANRQHYLRVEIPPLRGQILDRKGKELAISLKVPSIYAVPRLVAPDRRAELVKQVTSLLGLDPDFVKERFSRDKAFVWLKRHVPFEVAEKIREMKDPGLGILDEYRRFYPQGELLSQVLGFTDIDNVGLEGMELMMNRELQGRPGIRVTKRDAMGREIKAFEMKAIPAVDGNRVHLNIDQYLQYVTEKSLDRAYEQWKAKGAAAVLMEAKTGRILAIASRPTYDPNRAKESQADTRRNRAITDVYEPGSVFKIVAGSAAVNEGKVKIDQIFDCENGEYRYSKYTLHDVHPYGDLTFSEILIKSSNIGIVKVAAELAPEVFYKYLKAFGIGDKAGIDFPGEVSGFVRAPAAWSKTSPYNIPMGQEVTVTLIQLARAIAVIANGGNLVRPFLISHVEDQSGVELLRKQPVIRTGVLKPEAARTMREILIRAVEEGTGKSAQIRNVKVGGKTGTAQKILPRGGYSHSNFMSSFIGFAPGEDPELVMAVVLDDPKPKYYGGTVAAPVFREVMEVALRTIGYVPADAPLTDPATLPQGIPDNPPTAL